MTQAVGAHSTYDEPIATGGNREDLSDVLWDVSPTDTPFMTMAGKNKATATAHDWLTDTLEDVAANAHIEGDDATATAPASRVRRSNYTQIFKKHAVVTGTQERVDKGGGIKSEMAYQVARRMRAIKRDGEYNMIGVSNAKVAGDDTTAREMASFDAYLVTNNQFAATSTDPTGDGTDVSNYAGTDRALTEAIFQDALQSIWDNADGNKRLKALCSSHNKGVISTFTSAGTRYVTTDNKQLTASIDIYDGDFHTVTIVPDRFSLPGSVFLVDPEYVKVSELRKLNSYDLAKTGDSYRKELVWEMTLEVCNEKAHSNIGDLLEA